MAWRELQDGRGWCGRVQAPIGAIGPLFDEALQQLPLSIRAAVKMGGFH